MGTVDWHVGKRSGEQSCGQTWHHCRFSDSWRCRLACLQGSARAGKLFLNECVEITLRFKFWPSLCSKKTRLAAVTAKGL